MSDAGRATILPVDEEQIAPEAEALARALLTGDPTCFHSKTPAGNTAFRGGQDCVGSSDIQRSSLAHVKVVM
jgi:hypothetical protein